MRAWTEAPAGEDTPHPSTGQVRGASQAGGADATPARRDPAFDRALSQLSVAAVVLGVLTLPTCGVTILGAVVLGGFVLWQGARRRRTERFPGFSRVMVQAGVGLCCGLMCLALLLPVYLADRGSPYRRSHNPGTALKSDVATVGKEVAEHLADADQGTGLAVTQVAVTQDPDGTVVITDGTPEGVVRVRVSEGTRLVSFDNDDRDHWCVCLTKPELDRAYDTFRYDAREGLAVGPCR